MAFRGFLGALAPVVAIHAVPDAPPALVRAAVSACSTGAGACRDGTATSEEVAAELSWEPGGLVVEVTVVLPAGRRTRTLRFRAEDPEIERWRAAGFAVAVLVDATADPPPPPAASSSAPPPPPPSASSAPPVAPPPPPRAAEAEARRVAITLGPVVTTGLGGRPRLGVEARAGLGMVTVSLGGTLHRDDLGVEEELTWVGLGLITGAVPLGPMSLHGRAGGFVERFKADLEDAVDHDSRERLVGGARIGADVGYPLSPRVFVGGSLELGARFGTTTVYKRGERVDVLPILRPAAGTWISVWL